MDDMPQCGRRARIEFDPPLIILANYKRLARHPTDINRDIPFAVAALDDINRVDLPANRAKRRQLTLQYRRRLDHIHIRPVFL